MIIKTNLYKRTRTQEYINMSFLNEFLKKMFKDYTDELTELFIKNDGIKFYLLSLELFGYDNGLFLLEFKEFKNSFNVKLNILQIY